MGSLRNWLKKLSDKSMSVKLAFTIFLLLVFISWVSILFTGGLPNTNNIPVFMWGIGCAFVGTCVSILLLISAKLIKWSDRIK